jgi:hypothetical protein
MNVLERIGYEQMGDETLVARGAALEAGELANALSARLEETLEKLDLPDPVVTLGERLVEALTIHWQSAIRGDTLDDWRTVGHQISALKSAAIQISILDLDRQPPEALEPLELLWGVALYRRGMAKDMGG